jgi:hypothetical protein
MEHLYSIPQIGAFMCNVVIIIIGIVVLVIKDHSKEIRLLTLSSIMVWLCLLVKIVIGIALNYIYQDITVYYKGIEVITSLFIFVFSFWWTENTSNYNKGNFKRFAGGMVIFISIGCLIMHYFVK